MEEVPNMYPNLGDQREFTLNRINEIKDYFIADIRERELRSKRLSKYVASFDYFNKFIIVLSATSGGVFVAWFSSVIGAPEGIATASFRFAFSSTTGIMKKLLKTTRNKKKKHYKIVMITRTELNNIENTISDNR